MGQQELTAWWSASNFLELAVAAGDLVPGKKGWKTRQRQLLQAHLDVSQVELLGQTFASAIVSERVEAWIDSWPGPTWHRIVSGIANQLLHPVELPDGTAEDDMLPRWRWLLGELDGGIPLTQNGNFGRAFVRENAERFDWDLSGRPNTEPDLYDLHQLRLFAQRLRLTRRAGRTLTLSPKGKRLLADPARLWRETAAGILHGDEFTMCVGELFLALLAGGGSRHGDEIDAASEAATGEAGFREPVTYLRPDRRAVSMARYDTSNLCRALGLAASDGQWPELMYELTPVGAAIAMEALRGRATGPREY